MQQARRQADEDHAEQPGDIAARKSFGAVKGLDIDKHACDRGSRDGDAAEKNRHDGTYEASEPIQ
jgi:hypothetical protein